MRLFGLDITVRRALRKAVPLEAVDDRGWRRIFDWMPGAWQADSAIDEDSVLANWAVFSCMTLIAGDMGKMRLRLMRAGAGGTTQPATSPSFSPVLDKPNAYQTRAKFFESWMLSKLGPAGNTYVLKVRDDRGGLGRGNVRQMHVLDPQRCRPLVAPDGSVWYELAEDTLAQVPGEGTSVYVPASEIIHDRMWCLFHPLIGISPIYACSLAATQGLKIQTNSAKFFENMSRPSGILTAPAAISNEVASRLKSEWEANFGGDKIGRVAVLGDGLKYEAMSVTPLDAQLVEQLKISAQMVCSTYHVPAWMVGIGDRPPYQNASIEQQAYYGTCLQVHIEQIEALLDEGLGLAGTGYSTEFDLEDLIRLDPAQQFDLLGKGVGGGWLSPDEARARRNLPPVEGGATPYLQQQNYSLGALARRDAQADPFAPSNSAPAAEPPAEDDEEEDAQAEARALVDLLRAKQLEGMLHAA